MESMEYEHARNMTLLFFLERLLDKGEPRTLHDLSCQFGARGFTREMRQIAGGSQSGCYTLNLYINPYERLTILFFQKLKEDLTILMNALGLQAHIVSDKSLI